ncbi:hypothetical protein D3C75_704200 [compost metagenome]
MLHTVAQPDRLYSAICIHYIGQYSHRVRIVQEQSVRAHLTDICGKIKQHRYRAQVAENAANADSVRDRLPESVFLGNLKICNRTRIIAAYLDRINHVLGTAQRFLPVGVGLHNTCAAGAGLDIVQHASGILQPFQINIEQSQLKALQCLCSHTVT